MYRKCTTKQTDRETGIISQTCEEGNHKTEYIVGQRPSTIDGNRISAFTDITVSTYVEI